MTDDAIIARLTAIEREVVEVKQVVLDTATLLVEQVMDSKDISQLIKGGWRDHGPTAGLTWNTDMNGEEFVRHMRALRGDDLGAIMEVGPGYGRVLRTVLKEDLGLTSYVGVDISPANVEFLAAEFGDDRIHFVNSDVFEYEPQQDFDTIYSSAVFLHLYPDFGPALAKCHESLAEGGSVCFDVPEGSERYVSTRLRLYVRQYMEDDIRELVAAAGFSTCQVTKEFDFSPSQTGLFVVATK